MRLGVTHLLSKEASFMSSDPLDFHGIDYVEFYVSNARQVAHYYRTALGLVPVAYSGLETGVRDRGLGADYLVSLHAGPRREATVARAVTDETCGAPAILCRYEPFERADVVLSNDEMEAVVPRSALARFGGRLNFRLIAYANLDGGRQTRTSDHMPNLPAQFIAVR